MNTVFGFYTFFNSIFKTFRINKQKNFYFAQMQCELLFFVGYFKCYDYDSVVRFYALINTYKIKYLNEAEYYFIFKNVYLF